MTCFVEVIGGFFFLFTALYISRDKYEAEKTITGMSLAKHLQTVYTVVLTFKQN
jgi:hypothetical protein